MGEPLVLVPVMVEPEVVLTKDVVTQVIGSSYRKDEVEQTKAKNQPIQLTLPSLKQGHLVFGGQPEVDQVDVAAGAVQQQVLSLDIVVCVAAAVEVLQAGHSLDPDVENLEIAR